ncbi:hypothetical protein BIV59_06890 [Bacillus sp. MUM 13]|nr:hypothetical protein BIV59_06890 [Bacillus sp. MUM 13]
MVPRDRDKATFSQTLEMGRLTKEQLNKAIGHKLSNKNVLCTYAWRAFKTYAAENDMDIYQFKSDDKTRTKGLYHIQNVNNYHRSHQRNEVTMKDMIVVGNLIPNKETYDTFRVSKFEI